MKYKDFLVSSYNIFFNYIIKLVYIKAKIICILKNLAK